MEIKEQKLFAEFIVKEFEQVPQVRAGSIQGIPCMRLELSHSEPLHWRFYRYLAAHHFSTVIQNVSSTTYLLTVY